MVLDYGIYFFQQFKVCLAGGKTLVGTIHGIRIVTHQVELDSAHRFLHEILEGKRVSVNFLDKVIDDSKYIFKIRGSLKTNLKLYLGFKRKGRYIPRTRCNSKQKFLLDLISRGQKSWEKLLESDVVTFSRMCDAVCFDAQKAFSFQSEKLDVLKDNGHNRAFAVNVHNRFCKAGEEIKDNEFIGTLVQEYSKMLECIFDKRAELCGITHPFYRECELYNQFVIGTGDYNCEGLTTINERGVRDFVLEQLN